MTLSQQFASVECVGAAARVSSAQIKLSTFKRRNEALLLSSPALCAHLELSPSRETLPGEKLPEELAGALALCNSPLSFVASALLVVQARVVSFASCLAGCHLTHSATVNAVQRSCLSLSRRETVRRTNLYRDGGAERENERTAGCSVGYTRLARMRNAD